MPEDQHRRRTQRLSVILRQNSRGIRADPDVRVAGRAILGAAVGGRVVAIGAGKVGGVSVLITVEADAPGSGSWEAKVVA